MERLTVVRNPPASLIMTVEACGGYLCLRFICLLCRVKWPWLLCRLGTFLGDVAYLASARLRCVALSHLRLALSAHHPEEDIRGIRRRMFRLLGKSLVEFLCSPYLTHEELRRRVVLRGGEFLRSALEKGKGAILLTAHFGNWEWLVARVCAEGIRVSAIARPHSHPAINSLIDSIRHHNGVKVIPWDDVSAALGSLRNNEILVILPDRHAGRAGIPVSFFGRVASTFPVAAILALRTGAPIIPGFAVRKPDDTHLVTFYPSLELLSGPNRRETVRANTALCTKIIEDQIRQHPDHWMWFHNRWKS